MERCSPKEIWKTNAISSKKIGSNLQVADKSLAVAFKKPWNLLAGFHADSAASTARPREICEKPKWRREGDSNPRHHFLLIKCIYINKCDTYKHG